MMNRKLQALQKWLNIVGIGPALMLDGLKGPRTRQAILDTFANTNAPAITEAEIAAFAKRLGGTVAQMKAVIAVESGPNGFFFSGRPKILWERHYFWRRLRIIIPGLSNPKPGGYTNDANRNGISDSWERMADGMMIDPGKAIESASWGRGQVMGAWWKKLGYPSSIAFAWSMQASERDQFEAMVRYIEVFGLRSAFQALSSNPYTCRAFAKGYNGPGYAKGRYHQKLASAFTKASL